MLRRIKNAPPWAVLLGAWLILMVYAFPGQMTQDSFDHMREARDGIYSDAHPPMMNVLWKICDTIVAGPLGILVLQTITFLAGLYFLFRRTFEPRPAAWWAAALFIWPPSLTVMSVIWKDCVMAALLAVGAAALMSDKRSRRLWGLVAMFGATAFRYNAFGATLPLVVLLFQWTPGWHWLKRYALSTAAWLATTIAAFGVNSAITDKPMHYWQSSLAIYDIVGTYAYLDDDLPDAQIEQELAGTNLLTHQNIHNEMRRLYTPATFYPIMQDPHPLWDLPINGYVPAPEAQRDAISKAWWNTVTSHPLAYLKHRLTCTGEALGIGAPRGMGVPVKREFRWLQYAAMDMGLATRASFLQRKATRVMQFLARHTPFFVPWIYLLLSLVLIPLAWRQRDVLAIILSGIAMEGTLLPLVHSNDYRYSHWMVITTTIGIITLAARRYRTARLRA